MELHTQQGSLQPVAPFDWNRSLEFLGYFKPSRGEQSVGPGSLVKAVRENSQTVAFEVRSTGNVEQPALEYTLFSKEPLNDETARAVQNRISFFLSLDDDLRPFYEIGATDPAFAQIIQDLYGYHQVKFLTPFENTCWAILSQRNLMSVAHHQKQALTNHFDNCLEVNDQVLRAFPDADQLARLSAGEIDEVIHNERKAEGLSGVAAAFSRIDEEWLRTAPYAEVEKWLRSIKGIGEWSASFVLVRGLGRVEKLPVGEARILEAAGRLYRHGHRVTQADLAALGQPYGQWQGYWSHYLRVGV